MADDLFEVGFSTTDKLGSRIIRWATRSAVSHCWLSFPVLGARVVYHATASGVHVDWWPRWADHNRVVARFAVAGPGADFVAAHATKKVLPLLSTPYDFAAMVGFAWVLLGRCFGREWRNPFARRSAYFCSEFLLLWLRAAHVDGFEGFDAETVTPDQLLAVARSTTDLREVG